ncbi:hypothetical protein [Serratia liquefaciens]|uniref:hypothetical protein n=1 Tax=Serratia liquefaciens TaxID=614 RepID=UPI00165D1432|nr:hypothetical protein [Serratia liquefaciens]QNQ56158.1 hypothetical protein IAI46_09405 [Serratia liquefaciens]
MDNKLSELSKPVAWRYRYTKPGITDSHGEAWVGDWKFVTDEVNCNPAPNYQKCALYSQEYVSALLADIEYMRWRIKEMDLLFGGMLLTMQAAVIEAEHGEGPNIAMEWIINKLMGPGEFAPHSEKDAQAYFNRESEKIDAEYSKVMEFYKQRREAEKEQNNG